MSTMAQLIQRTYNEWLNPLDDYPMYGTLQTSIDNVTTSVIYTDDLLTLEEVDLLDAGGVIELDSELMRVTDVDTGTRTLTVVRGVLGSSAVLHTAGVEIFVNPRPTRVEVFNALADAVVDLGSDLYRVRSEDVEWDGELWEMPDALGREVLEHRYRRHDGQWVRGGGGELLHDHPELNGGTGLQLRYPYGDQNYVRYASVFPRPTAESDDLTSTNFGIDASWEKLLVIHAVASVVASVDLSAITQEYIGETLASQGFPAGRGANLRNSLLQLGQLEVERAKVRLEQRDRRKVVYTSIFD